MRRKGYNPHDGPGKRRERSKPGPIPTLGQMRRQTCWLWLYCRAFARSAPVALAPFIIRWRPMHQAMSCDVTDDAEIASAKA
jgi:hypothetical protein